MMLIPVNVCIRAVTQNIFTYEDDFGVNVKACPYVAHSLRYRYHGKYIDMI